MPTTIVNEIRPSGGGDYTSLNAWESAEQRNLVSADEIEQAEVYSGGTATTGTFTIAGWTTDLTRRVIVKAASGEQHNGTRSQATSACAYVDDEFNATQGHTTVDGLRIETSSSTASLRVGSGGNSVQATWLVQNCLLGCSVGAGCRFDGANWDNTNRQLIRSCIIFDGLVVIGRSPATAPVHAYNCTIIASSGVAFSASLTGAVCYSNNNYLRKTSGTEYSAGAGATFNQKGPGDATSGTDATTVANRNIAYSTANFTSVTTNSEDLHLTGNSALLQVGVAGDPGDTPSNFTGLDWAGDTDVDFEGDSRPAPGFSNYSAGADESTTPICWNYTAKYKGSNRLYKVSGPGVFPKKLNIPMNVDKSTGRMIDDGILIDPDEYEVV